MELAQELPENVNLSKFLREQYNDCRIKLITAGNKIRAPYLVAHFDYQHYNLTELKTFTDLLHDVAIKFQQLRFAIDLAYDVNTQKLPSFCIVTEEGNKHHYRKNILNIDELTAFCTKSVESIKFHSEPLPTDNKTSLIKKAVALNFDELILENQKDVFIAFHWTSRYFMHDLLPIVEGVAKVLSSSSDLEDIDVIRMNMETNTIPRKWLASYKAQVFVYIRHRQKDQIIEFNGSKESITEEALLNFIAKHSTKELKYCNRDGIKRNRK